MRMYFEVEESLWKDRKGNHEGNFNFTWHQSHTSHTCILLCISKVRGSLKEYPQLPQLDLTLS